MSYLDATFLEGSDDLGAEGPTVPMAPAPGEPAARLPAAPAPAADVIRLPGGIAMPRSTFYLLLGVVVAAAIYLYMKRKRE